MQQELYSHVDRILVPHTALQHAIKRIGQCYRAAHTSAEPICIALIGESRAGKSRALEHFETIHVRQRLDDGLRVPILRVDTPATPTTRGLAEVLLDALGDPSPDKGTVTSMTRRLVKLLKATENRMIMVDEFQHFYDTKSHKVMHHVANWLKNVINKSKVSLVVSGLPTCQAVIEQNEQLAGRFLAPIRMPRFDWNNPELRAEFIGILGAFHDGLTPFELPQLDSDEMAFRFYCATGGLIGYLAKILRQAIWNAISEGHNKITLEDIARAHQEAVFTEETANDLPRAFERGFAACPTEALLQRVKAIGIAAPEEIPHRRRKTGGVPLTAAQVLHK